MKTYFSEIQSFRSLWVLLFFIPLNGLFLYGIIQQIILGIPWGTNPAPDIWLIIIEVFIAIFSLWFWNIQLITKVDKEGIHIKFKMFWLNFKTYKYNQIESYKIREYNAIKEYGGWGIRIKKNNRSYTVSGKHGVQLVLKNGKKVLIGSQKVKGLLYAIEESMNL